MHCLEHQNVAAGMSKVLEKHSDMASTVADMSVCIQGPELPLQEVQGARPKKAGKQKNFVAAVQTATDEFQVCLS